MFGTGHFGAHFPVGILDWEMSQKSQNHDHSPHASGLSARHRHPTWWSFSNTSTTFSWVESVPFAMYTTTLPREGRKRWGKLSSARFKSARFAHSRAAPLEESTGGRGSVVVTGPLQKDCDFQKIQNVGNIFHSNLLAKCIFQVPVAG